MDEGRSFPEWRLWPWIGGTLELHMRDASTYPGWRFMGEVMPDGSVLTRKGDPAALALVVAALRAGGGEHAG